MEKLSKNRKIILFSFIGIIFCIILILIISNYYRKVEIANLELEFSTEAIPTKETEAIFSIPEYDELIPNMY